MSPTIIIAHSNPRKKVEYKVVWYHFFKTDWHKLGKKWLFQKDFNNILVSQEMTMNVRGVNKIRLRRDYRWIVCPSVLLRCFGFTARVYITSSKCRLSGSRLNQLCLHKLKVIYEGWAMSYHVSIHRVISRSPQILWGCPNQILIGGLISGTTKIL